MLQKRICVIGAGSSGLAATKSCKEDGLNVVCYEEDDDIGGLWRYRESDTDGKPSVMKTTIINTSKEMSAYSDFPPPDHFPNYMHNSLFWEYLCMYAKHFDLRQHIMFQHKVLKVQKCADYEKSGKWMVTAKDLIGDTLRSEVFDGVMVCSGHHIYPNIPHFKGLDDFQGKVIHSHSLKSVAGYDDQNVLVVGIGNSAVDAAVEISRVAEKVYLSTRRGSWVFPRLFFAGKPFDISLQRRILVFLYNVFKSFSYLPDRIIEFILNVKFDHEFFQLKPKHHVFSAHPTTNDALPATIISGKVAVKQDVSEFKKNGVIFKNEDQVTSLDAVVLATGYNIRLGFVEDDVLKINNNRIRLYKLMFPPSLQHPSLVFIGLMQSNGAFFPVAESQSRWFVHLMSTGKNLPSKEEMDKEINARQAEIERIFVNSSRHTIQVQHIDYMNEICSEFGAKPNFWKMAFTDPKLFYACWFKGYTSYQCRLQGPHAWAKARDAILSVNERMKAAFKTRCIAYE